MNPGREQSLLLNITVSSGSGTGTSSPVWTIARWVRVHPVNETDTYTLQIKDAGGGATTYFNGSYWGDNIGSIFGNTEASPDGRLYSDGTDLVLDFLNSATFKINGTVQLNAQNISTDTTTGMKIGTGTTQKIGFFNKTPAIQQTDGANLTNNVTSGGTTDTIANYTDLTVYANDAAAIRNDIYQIARKLKIVDDALRVYGLLS